jgi:predicted HicB family RNase H-like nuclease
VQTQSPTSYQQVLQVAEHLFRQEPDWVTFFREVLGIDGAVRQTFPSFDDLTAFERSDEYAVIQKMLVKLREKKPSADADTEPTRVITVRLPKSMHEYLRTEAHDLRTSMNKLCISKLLQVIEQDMIPAERSGPPKRRTTPVAAPAAAPAASLAPTPAQVSAPASTLAGLQQPAASNGQPPFGTSF